MTLLVATTNAGKIREIRHVLQGLDARLLTLADVPAVAEPDETGTTFWENARQKALAYAAATGLTAVAEDSGLEIDALDGEPGIHSARFLGAGTPYDARFAEIYRRLEGRAGAPFRARFVTALAVAHGDTVMFETEARIEGFVAQAPTGTGGFGYDPIFWYAPLGRTTAEMTADEKASVSHRARAFRDLRRAIMSGTLAVAPATH